MNLLRDRYAIQHQLGKKAGRQTLLAQDLQTQASVVVKVLTFSPDFHWDDLKLFEREAETLKSLEHPAIPRYLDYFELDSASSKGFALVQSYIAAKSLEDHLKAGRSFSETEIKQLAEALLDILTYLHGRQPAVIHRDIKPSNILLGDRSGNHVGEVYLVDFGSVQTLAATEGGTITVVGTYGYMPPEQYGGRAVPASDLYSLGATCIYLATGKHPADLPQKNLQIQFIEAVTLSSPLIDWLQWMTEPALDHRLNSPQDALTALRTEQPRPGKLSTPLPETSLARLTPAQIAWGICQRNNTLSGAVVVAVWFVIYSVVFSGYDPLWFRGLVGGVLGAGLGFFSGILGSFLVNRLLARTLLCLSRWSIGLVTGLTHALLMGILLLYSTSSWTEKHLLMFALLGLMAGVSSQ
jgi:serine/threonine protein kinase